MREHWFAAIYEGKLLKFKINAEYREGVLNSITLDTGEVMDVDFHDMAFGEEWWLRKVLEQLTGDTDETINRTE